MNRISLVRRFSACKNAVTKPAAMASVAAMTLASQAHAQAAPYDGIFDAIDLAGISTKVIAVGVVIIGIALVMKAITLGKKTVNKA